MQRSQACVAWGTSRCHLIGQFLGCVDGVGVEFAKQVQESRRRLGRARSPHRKCWEMVGRACGSVSGHASRALPYLCFPLFRFFFVGSGEKEIGSPAMTDPRHRTERDIIWGKTKRCRRFSSCRIAATALQAACSTQS